MGKISLPEIELKLDLILKNLARLERRVMAAFDDLKAELVAANSATNEIANDIQDLINKLANPGGLTAAEATEIQTQLNALRSRLEGVASQHTS